MHDLASQGGRLYIRFENMERKSEGDWVRLAVFWRLWGLRVGV